LKGLTNKFVELMNSHKGHVDLNKAADDLGVQVRRMMCRRPPDTRFEARFDIRYDENASHIGLLGACMSETAHL
jgi:hypothetical protein